MRRKKHFAHFIRHVSEDQVTMASYISVLPRNNFSNSLNSFSSLFHFRMLQNCAYRDLSKSNGSVERHGRKS